MAPVQDALEQVLRSTPRDRIDALAAAVTEEDVPAGRVLISEGEGQGDAFVLLSGRSR